MAPRYGFTVSVAEPVSHAARREVLVDRRARRPARRPARGRPILGRPFAIEGVVRRGQQLGRQLGFPTANVEVEDYVVPKLGVYATRTRLPDGREVPGVANLGNNPTTGEVETRLEDLAVRLRRGPLRPGHRERRPDRVPAAPTRRRRPSRSRPSSPPP
jgi:riboflavin kinase/FMN adenylyltransferase